MTRGALLAHSHALTAACEYQENELMVCVLDFKREMGLWHSILTVRFFIFLISLFYS